MCKLTHLKRPVSLYKGQGFRDIVGGYSERVGVHAGNTHSSAGRQIE